MSTPGTPGGRGWRRVDASMTLLTQVLERPLDPGYAAAAQRREEQGRPRSTGTRSWLVLLAAVVVGLLLVVAHQSLRPSGTTASRDKQQLIDQIRDRQAHGDAQAAAAQTLRGQVDRTQQQALGTGAGAAELSRLSLLTGDTAARGPGLTVTLDDAPAAQAGAGQPRSGGSADEGRVTSLDLQVVVNGLWQAGAEAVAVNGQRLTARSAIRFAGQAILVDYRPLTPPYVVTALGDPRGLPAAFAQTVGGSYLDALRANYAIPSTVSTGDDLTVPRGGADVVLARPTPTPEVTR
ncbi:DUF881 domain-containing protein [Lapillicoccus jejuensis]|uniref:Uncharacterized protein YlxW (UPF0749 family) n=1 Tax=Lapillicoccus jejuensis TaxID=402171 RepID=A0A542E533_9MICO|nr:DUF881 domain-containing protein [Lapillicoccus jejuensis]TQJ10435.1 uncharacterized protein YlxW (UPF0749 family) [Lapillicoccus jejuensis]